MKKILYVWIIIAVILVSGLTFIGIKIKNQNAPYTEIEKELVFAAQSYMGQYINEMPSSQTTVSYKKLLETGLIKENEHQCDGYVFISKKIATFDYKAYIKCDKYTTRDFDESKVEKWKKSWCYLLA